MKKVLSILKRIYNRFRETRGEINIFSKVKENRPLQKKIEDCIVTITFSENKNPNLKENLLWYLTQCYEARINSKEQSE